MIKKINNKAQFHVLEGVMAIVLIFLAFYFVYSVSLTPTAEPHISSQLSSLADEAFYIMKYTPGEENIIPVPEHCVGWWDFEEGSGITANDNSGNSNDGTLIGNCYFTTSNVQGDYAIKFDGAGDFFFAVGDFHVYG